MRIFSTLIILCATAICHAQTKFSFEGKSLTSSRNNIYVSSKAKTNAKKFTFNSMNEALAFAEKNAADSTTIYIEPSVYWIDNPDDDGIRKPLNGENEPFGMKVKISNLKIRKMWFLHATAVRHRERSETSRCSISAETISQSRISH